MPRTLIVAGNEDRPVAFHNARAVAAGVSGSLFERLPATGHAVMIEQPEWFNARMAQLSSHTA